MYISTKTIKNWKQINYRNVDSMMSVQFIYDLYDQYDAKINWFRFKNVVLFYQDYKLWSYTPQEDWDKAITNIANQFKSPRNHSNPEIIRNSSNYCIKKKRLLLSLLKKLDNTDLTKLSNKKLFDTLFNWYQTTLNQIYYINVAPVELGLQKAIDDLCVKYKTSEKDRSVLYSLDDNTEVMMEELALLKSIAANGYKCDDKLVDKHYAEFKHLTIGYGSKEMNKIELIERFNHTVQLGKKFIDERIREMEEYPNVIKAKKLESNKNINNEHLSKLFKLAADLGILRDRNKALLGKSVSYRNIILKEVSRRFNIKHEKLKYYLLEEIRELMLNNQELPEREISNRKEGVYISSISKLSVGDDARENYFQSFKEDSIEDFDLKKLKGICASPGISRGIVKVCLSSDECDKLNEGEILVTYGTDFNYLNAMVRSSAIVTEEGGILSHASVISRELNKPCIIGFKGITKYLQDGDEIEVDATSGKITLIKKQSNNNHLSLSDKIYGVYTLNETVSADEIGNKAYNLAVMTKNKLNVPKAIVLGVSYFKDLLRNQDKYDVYMKYAKNLSKYEKEICELIDSISFDNINFENLLDFRNNTYAVRSSSPCEDALNKSFAGQFTTELYCNNQAYVEKSIRACWKSFLNKNLEVYAHEMDVYFGAVVIQKMINADYAGVLFTKNPVDNSDSIVVECCKGVAAKLVDNKVDPSRFYVDGKANKVCEKIENFDVDDDVVIAVAKEGLRIKEIYKMDMDIEWAYENGEIFIIQCRPITT